MSFTLVVKGTSHYDSQPCCLCGFCGRYSPSTMIVPQDPKMERFFGGMSLPLKCTHTLCVSLPLFLSPCGWRKTMPNSHSGNKTLTPVAVSPWNVVTNPTPGVFFPCSKEPSGAGLISPARTQLPHPSCPKIFQSQHSLSSEFSQGSHWEDQGLSAAIVLPVTPWPKITDAHEASPS